MSTPWDTAGRIRRHLRTIRNVWAATLTTINQPDNDPVTGSTIPNLIPTDVLDARYEARKDLRLHAGIIRENIGGRTTHLDSRNIDQLCTFIDTWALLYAEQLPEDGINAATHFERHADHLVGLVKGDRIRRYHVGRCPELTLTDDQLTPCTGTLIATMKQGDSLLPKVVACDANPEHVWQPWQWASLGKRLDIPLEQGA